MKFFLSFLFFVFGMTFGSFFNVVGIRSPKNKSFVNDRSHCPKCNKTLAWYELIPIFSYLLQRGKCRECKEKISIIYPIVEMLTGVLFMLSYLYSGLEVELITALLLVSMLMIIFVSDIHYMIIENKILLFFLPLFILLRIIEPLEPWWSPIAGATVITGLLALIILVSRGGMGAGDMKLFGVLGIVLGLQKVLLAFFLSCLIGAVVGVLLISIGFVGRKQPIPFGPFIVIGALIAYFYGEEIIQLYISLF